MYPRGDDFSGDELDVSHITHQRAGWNIHLLPIAACSMLI